MAFNKNYARCRDCNESFPVKEMHKVESFSMGHWFLCEKHHMEHLEDRTYNEENMEIAHQEKKHGLTISFEMEIAIRTVETEIYKEWGFLPTHDSTVDIEYKSPIYKSKNGLKQLFRSMEKVTQLGTHLNYGTHLNIGHKDFKPDDMEYVRRFYHSLFVPLCKAMLKNELATTKLHGRSFMGWAEAITENTNPTEHENFVNVQHIDYTNNNTWMEFRMCKFINAEQYFNLIQMYTEIMTALMNNFVSHFNDNIGTTDSDAITAYRTHKAQIASGKFVKIFNKYASKI